MLFFTDKTTVRVRNALLAAGLFLVIGSACGLFGCQTSPRPGEATITGGTASAQRYENGGWSFRMLPTTTVPAPAPVEKTGPWVLILHPLPQDPAKVPAAIKAGESPTPTPAPTDSAAPSSKEPRTP